MKLIIVGVKHFQGTGKQSGKPYSFVRVLALMPASLRGPVQRALGYEVVELDAPETTFDALASEKLPRECEVDYDLGGDGKMRISTVKPLSRPASAVGS